jgi:phage head maturation protease
MTPIKVYGFALPYGERNSYNEILPRGALDKWLAKHSSVPMGFEHLGPCGRWTKLTNTPEGLFCEGEITDPRAAKAFREGYVPELSISFRQAPGPDGLRTYSRERMNSYVQQFGRGPVANVVDCNVVREAGLAEISLVNRGAFNGTYVREAT